MRKEREQQYIERIERCLTDQVDQRRDSSSKVIIKGNLSLDQQRLLKTYYMALRTGNTVTKSSKKARSYATFYEYIRHLRRFGVYINKEYLEANLDDVEGFIELYSSCSQSVLNSIAKTIKCFYAWLAKREKLDFNEIVETLENMKFDKCMIERLDQNKLLDDSDILKLINSADLARDKALISVLSESGCRVGELIDLNVGNISFDSYGAFIDIQESKTKKRKIRLIISEPYLRRYKNQHAYKNNSEAPLFYCLGTRDYGKRFPSSRVSGNKELEEERRVFYVACSRAKKNLEVTAPLEDFTPWGGYQILKESKFITEIPKKYYEDWIIDEEE